MRAVWLTTIGGLDWPHTKAHSTESREKQQRELEDILDRLQEAKFNTVFLQARVRSTVIWPSAIEPWDDCLTGHAGKDPGYDPMAFAVEACHKRGLELHAWVVAIPGNSLNKAKALGKRAMQQRLPSLCLRSGEGWMLDPGQPGTAPYLASLCAELTRNYDIDGIHLDYLRYPEKEVRYNDTPTYRRYGNGQNKAQWRRDNITRCAKEIYKAVKTLKPWVRVSCSPVGKHDDLPRYSSKGWNAYTAVSQDAQGWMLAGYMDMIVPMMYFQGNHFYPFVQDWVENSGGRIVVPGLGAYLLAAGQKDWPLETIERECHVIRTMGAGGQAYFRSRFVTDNTKGLYDFLKQACYTAPAFTPPLTWEKATPPAQPTGLRIESRDGQARLLWDTPDTKEQITYNVYKSYTRPTDIGDTRNLIAQQLKQTRLELGTDVPDTFRPHYAVTAMDRYGNESLPARLEAPQPQAPTSFCTGLLLLRGDTLVLPSKNLEEYILVTGMGGQTICTLPYTTLMNTAPLQMGLYDIRTLGKKGKDHYLGRLFKR